MGAALSTAGQCALASNADIAGVGARTSVYAQNILCFLPAIWAIADEKITDYELDSMETMSTTNLVIAFGILISCFIQASTLGLSSFHASIVLSMSWMNNTNVFIYFLLYAAQLKEKDGGWMKSFKDRMVSKVKSSFRSLFCLTGVLSTPGPDTEAAVHRPEQTTATATPTPPAPPLTMRQLVRRVSLVFGSLHLTLMSGLGLWLWSNPRTFGTSDSECAVDHAHLAVAGADVPFGSSALRAFSLFIYGLFLIPGLNLVLPTAVFLGLYIWHGKRHPAQQSPEEQTNSQDTTQPPTEQQPKPSLLSRSLAVIKRVSSPKSPVFPAFIGLCFLLAINIIFVVDIELTPKSNKKIQQSGEAEWGFGQVLAVLLLFLPLRDLMEMIFRRRQELQTQMDNALRKAIAEKKSEDISRWIDAGADINTKADDGCTVIEAVFSVHGWDALQTLVTKGVDVNQKFRDGTTALEAAANAQNIEITQILLQSGADANAVLKRVSGLQKTHEWKGTKFLITCGARIDMEWKAGWCNELGKAIQKASLDDCKTLIELKIDVNTMLEDGSRALEVACLANKWDLVSEIVNAGADVNTPFKDDNPALWTACEKKGPQAVIELLLEKGADVNARGQGFEKLTSLHQECMNGRDEIAQLLLDHGADPILEDVFESTPLHIACIYGTSKCAEILLKHVKNPADLANAKDDVGSTPLHYAYMEGHQDCVKLLLANGADNTIQNNIGQTPPQRAPVGFNLDP